MDSTISESAVHTTLRTALLAVPPTRLNNAVDVAVGGTGISILKSRAKVCPLCEEVLWLCHRRNLRNRQHSAGGDSIKIVNVVVFGELAPSL